MTEFSEFPTNPNSGADPFNVAEFENTLKGYGELFYPPPPPAKRPIAIYAILGALALALAGVGAFAYLTSRNVAQTANTVASLSTQVAERTEVVVPKVDLSGVEGDLQNVTSQNEEVLARLTRLETQVVSLSATVAAITPEVVIVQQPFAGTNTPHADTSQTQIDTSQIQSTTPEPIPTVTLAENEFIVRAETSVYFVPDTSAPFVARFSAETRITALGGFRNINEQVWLVIKPTREMNLNLTPDTTEQVIYDERLYAFVLYNETVTGELTMIQNVPLPMTLTDNRTLRSAPETVLTNVIENTILLSTPWNVLGVYTHPTTQIQWIVLDLTGTQYENAQRTRAFILFSVPRDNAPLPIPAFGGIDLEILAWMPEFPYTPPNVPLPTPAPAEPVSPVTVPVDTPPIDGEDGNR